MASSSKTAIGLNHWHSTDRPKREDFNNDNQVLTQQLEEAKSHHSTPITQAEGAHGLRFIENRLECSTPAGWQSLVVTPSGSEPKSLPYFSIRASEEGAQLSWQDPEDTTENGVVTCRWKGTRIVRKAGSFPQDERDGVVVVDSTLRGRYADTFFLDSFLTKGVVYFYQAFPYSDENMYNTDNENRRAFCFGKAPVFGVCIDTTQTDPFAAVSYIDDAVGMEPGAPWEGFSFFEQIRPCLFQNGKVTSYLNPADFSRTVQGTSVDLSNPENGDVMIEIPRLAYRIEKEGSNITVRVTSAPPDDSYRFAAHTRDPFGDRDFLYIGAYMASKPQEALHSLSGLLPVSGESLDNLRQAAQSKGEGYDLLGYYPLVLLQCLFLLKYKTLDSQTALGMGYTATQNTQPHLCGICDQEGMDFGEETGTQPVKFLGLEDFWGNLRCLIEGISTYSMGYYTAHSNFNSKRTEYSMVAPLPVKLLQGNVQNVAATNSLGFLIEEASGNEPGLFCDYGRCVDNNRFAYFGGCYNDSTNAGLFATSISILPTSGSALLGSRIMYL